MTDTNFEKFLIAMAITWILLFSVIGIPIGIYVIVMAIIAKPIQALAIVGAIAIFLGLSYIVYRKLG